MQSRTVFSIHTPSRTTLHTSPPARTQIHRANPPLSVYNSIAHYTTDGDSPGDRRRTTGRCRALRITSSYTGWCVSPWFSACPPPGKTSVTSLYIHVPASARGRRAVASTEEKCLRRTPPFVLPRQTHHSPSGNSLGGSSAPPPLAGVITSAWSSFAPEFL